MDVIVAGHLCIDLLPRMETLPADALSYPGRLYEVGAMDIATGGAVANTGLALHQLGLDVRLMSLVGEDAIGRMIVDYLSARDPELARCIIPIKGVGSSYSVVLSPARSDRIFLHHPGTNSHFGPEHVDLTVAEQARIVHVGYPPILPRMMIADGAQMVELFRGLKDYGVVTSLDTVVPDPHGASGKVNWRAILRNTLPYVDIFVPSFEEIVFMLHRSDFDRGSHHLQTMLTRNYLMSLTDELLEMGVAIAGVKCGVDGLWLRTGDRSVMNRLRDKLFLGDDWNAATTWHPSFAVDVVGTTGAGDAAYAGLMAAMLRNLGFQDATRIACAVGACCVEAADAVSAVRTWEDTILRASNPWPTNPSRLAS
jgi:sugar/nucleoside kinase (ribokinase family)